MSFEIKCLQWVGTELFDEVWRLIHGMHLVLYVVRRGFWTENSFPRQSSSSHSDPQKLRIHHRSAHPLTHSRKNGNAVSGPSSLSSRSCTPQKSYTILQETQTRNVAICSSSYKRRRVVRSRITGRYSCHMELLSCEDHILKKIESSPICNTLTC